MQEPGVKIPGLPDVGHADILDVLPCYVSIQDRDMNIVYTNKAFVQDFGDGMGQACYRVYKGRDSRCQDCPVYKTLKDGNIHLSEETVQLSTGEVNDMIVYSAPIRDRKGQVVAAVEMSTNITRIKQINQELTFLGQSIALVSHDIKNIVEGLQGGAYVVDAGIKDEDMTLARKGWAIVKKNIAEIATATGNILYSSKKRAIWRQKVYISDLLDSALATFQEKAASMRVELAREVNGALPMAHLDSSSIQRMLRNLILNALQACKADSSKASHKVTARLDFHDEAHFKFEIEDNGSGMDDKSRKNIFTGYFSTKGSLGTGLGLAVVDKIIKEHGGVIEVMSKPGKGCLFRVILPYDQTAAARGAQGD